MHPLSTHWRPSVIAATLLASLLASGAWAAPAACVDPLADPVYPPGPGGAGVNTPAAAIRFLNMATYGATTQDKNKLLGQSFAAWIDEQMALDASCHQAYLNQTQNNNSRENRMEVWWRLAAVAPDQLRQRVAFALSEILVVSDVPGTIPTNAIAGYYDILVRNAFGNYRDLLEQVTLSPAMGRYLSMLGNQKPNKAEGIRADENYAREIMQLFSIGLVRLNPDGTPLLVGGKTVPTYDQKDIEGLARVFTGWTWGDSFDFWDGDDWRLPMKPFESYHDRKEKRILDNTVVPAGGDARTDLALALDTLFNHPNVGPFIGRQLIQRLVTSNPSPQYVARVSAVFNDNGQGVRGDLGAVVKAILLDPEALGGPGVNPNFGKLREPVLVLTHLWRAMKGRSYEGTLPYYYPDYYIGQAPMSARSVFNFFRPDYAPTGALKKKGLVAPEFQLVNDANNVRFYNELLWRISHYYRGNEWADPHDVLINLKELKDLADRPEALVDRVDLVLTGNRLPDAIKTMLVNYLRGVDLGEGKERGVNRATDALYLVMSSPYYLIQR